MNWLDVVSNPRAVTHLYKVVPPLEGVEVTWMTVKSAGPCLCFLIELPEAENKPARWSPENNAVAVELDFFVVTELKIDGFTPAQMLSFHFEKQGQQISVLAQGPECRITFLCLEAFIQKVSGYVRELDDPA